MAHNSSTTIEIKIVNDLDALAHHKKDWNELAAITSPFLPTCSYAWIASHFEYFTDSDETWACFFAYENDTLVGVLPLMAKNLHYYFMSYQILSVPKNSETLGVSPLLKTGSEQKILNELIHAAWAHFPAAICLQILDVPVETHFLQNLKSPYHILHDARIGRYLPVNGNQDEYQSSLSKNFRSNQKKSANKLAGMADIKYEFFTGDDAKPEYLTEYADVEMASWKGREGTAIKCSEQMSSFYSTLVNRLYESGWLEWHILRTEGRAIAVNLAIHVQQGILLWKLGYDDAYAKCSPGGMLFQKLLERVFPVSEIAEINLLTDAKWYDNWNMARREYREIRFYHTKRLRSVLLGLIPDQLMTIARKNDLLRSTVRQIKKYLKK